MAKLTQKQLIEQLGILKEIKPRREWAVLLKFQLLPEKRAEVIIPAQKVSFMDALSAILFQRKLAYSFAVALFMIVGVFGFAVNTVPGDLLFPVKKIAEQSQAALSGQTTLRQDVTKLSNRINDLAQAAKYGRVDNIPSVISEINNNASELAKNIKNNSVDLATMKEIAVSLKTLANVPGTDLTANPDVKDLYQIIVQSQIADLRKTTLTEDQNNALTEAEELYFQGKYIDALEKILLINK